MSKEKKSSSNPSPSYKLRIKDAKIFWQEQVIRVRQIRSTYKYVKEEKQSEKTFEQKKIKEIVQSNKKKAGNSIIENHIFLAETKSHSLDYMAEVVFKTFYCNYLEKRKWVSQ